MRDGRTYAAIFALIAATVVAEQPAAAVLSIVSTVLLPGVHGRIGHLAADSHHGRLFVAIAGNDSVEVIDVRTNSLFASIHEVKEPHSVAYVESSNKIFLTNGADGTLRIFDGASLKPSGNVHLGNDPGAIRVDGAGQKIYVGYGHGMIGVFDPAGKKLGDIALPSHPESFQLSENQPWLYVNLPGSHSIAVVDVSKLKVIAEWPIPDAGENFALALDSEKRRMFVVCRRPSRLVVLNMDSGKVVARLPTAGDADDLFYDAIHARIYVIGGQGKISVYSQQTADLYSELDSVATVAGTRTGLFVPEWNRFVVAVRDFGAHSAEIRIYQPQ